MEGEKNHYQQGEAGGAQVEDQEVKSRGVFDFLKKEDNKEEEAIVSGMDKVHMTTTEAAEAEKKDEEEEEEKKEGMFAKLHRSGSSSSSSSSSEEEVGPDGEKRKKKKGLKDKIKEKIGGGDKNKDEGHDKPAEHVPPPPPVYSEDTSVKVEKVDEPVKLSDHQVPPPHDDDQEEKKGFIEKIKDKLPGHKKPEPDAVPATTHEEVVEGKEKKGILGKIMEKIKGPDQQQKESGENYKSNESH